MRTRCSEPRHLLFAGTQSATYLQIMHMLHIHVEGSTITFCILSHGSQAPAARPDLTGDLTLSDVTLTYGDGKKALRNFTCDFPTGSKVSHTTTCLRVGRLVCLHVRSSATCSWFKHAT